MENLSASLKTEHVHLVRFRTRDEVKAVLLDYAEILRN